MLQSSPKLSESKSSSVRNEVSNSAEEVTCQVENRLVISSQTDNPGLSSPISFEDQWKFRAKEIESELDAQLTRWTAGGPERLVEAIRYSLLAPGKRLRPLLALWAAEVVGGDYKVAFPAAVAVEMIHCYSLIHDDLPAMDDDDLRRGRPTCHIQFDESTAILAGDALQPMAFAVLANSFHPTAYAARACQLLASAAGPIALVGGQAEDLQAEKVDWKGCNAEEKEDAKSLLARIHARKTGAMIRVSLELGALAADANPDQMAAIASYGEAIGQAFQIVDDLLDVQSTSDQLGKRAGKDEAAGKLTYPSLYGVAESFLAAKDYTEKAVQALEIFGSHGEPLVRLAKTILERTH